jgi:glycosyltransferase involved in cell wall biosynthesis
VKPFKAAGRAVARAVWLARSANRFRDDGPPRRPRLLIDVSVIRQHDARTGIQRVVRGISSALTRLEDTRFKAVPVFATARSGYCFNDDQGRARPVQVRQGDRFLALDLAAHLLPSYRRQVAAWRRAGASVHVVVYDLLPVQCPEWFNPKTVRHFTRWWQFVSRSADQLLCISDHVAAEVSKALPSGAAPVVGRLHLAGDIATAAPAAGLTEAENRLLARLSQQPFVLMVGTVEPRKAYDVALAAFEQLWRQEPDGPDLVIAGKPGWKTEALQGRLRKHPEFADRLHWLQDAGDDLLQRLYDTCAGVFMASHAEGFGLPAAEAASHGAPVLVRDLPVFRDQRLPAVSYFTDDRPAPLARMLAALASAPRHEPASSGPTWDECAQRLLAKLDSSTRR